MRECRAVCVRDGPGSGRRAGASKADAPDSRAKEMPMSMGASLREGPTSVIVSELPPGYSEVLFVEDTSSDA